MALKPIRRVVTTNDEHGRSRVLWDGPAPNTHETPPGTGRGWTDLWVFDECPAPLSGDTDEGFRHYDFPAAPTGGHLRVVSMKARQPGYDPATAPDAVPIHEVEKAGPGAMWEKGGQNAFSSAFHKTESVDYGIVLEGERFLILDDRELLMKKGDIVVQLGAWHQWSARTSDCRMAFVLMGAGFELAAPPGPPVAPATPPPGVKPVRRIVTRDKDDGTATAIYDGPSPDVHGDPARPGFGLTRIWVTDSSPAKIKVSETLHMPNILEPPACGSVCYVLTIPPDSAWQGRAGEHEVRAFFEAMGAPHASTYSTSAPHPYMQKTRTLDFALVLEGEPTLVLDTGEVTLGPTDIAILRGANHAFSNRTSSPAVIAVSSHDGRY